MSIKKKMFEDPKMVFKSCKSTKDRQYNGQMKRDKDLQNTYTKTKD